MNSELEKYLNEAKEIGEVLFKDQFQLSDIGLTPKTAFDWTNYGIYLRERDSKYRRSYNGIEYVWLRMVKDLREIGLPVKAIQKVRDYLLTKIDLVEYFNNLNDPEDEQWQELSVELKRVFRSGDKAVALVNKKRVNLLETRLAVIIFSSILGKMDTHLLITKEGECLIYDESPKEDRFTSSHILRGLYISVPLNVIIGDFIEREHLYEIDTTDEGVGVTLSEEEKKILSLIRKGDISSLNVKFQNNTIYLIETEEKINPKEVKGKLVDLIERGGYQEISYKTQKGKIVSLTRKTKHK